VLEILDVAAVSMREEGNSKNIGPIKVIGFLCGTSPIKNFLNQCEK
jgi:hypothetical protein